MSPTDAGATPMQPGLSATAVLAIAVACVAIACITLLIPAAPSYDPWAWLVWGREVLRGDLQTVTGPSWKPLPVLFTAPFSLFGDVAPSLWLIVARAAHLGSAAVAAAVGFRLAGRFGALATGGLILVAPEFWPSVLLGNSEGILVLCVLGAFERHLAGRSGQAFALAVAAGLIRAEAWPFLLLYAAWLVVRDPSRLRWVAPGLALLPVLWLLPELWGSGSLSRGADRALRPDPSAPAFAAHPALRVMGNMVSLMSLASFTGLGCAAVMIGLRRAPRSAVGPVLGLAAVGVAWVGLVAVMTEFGFSGI